MTPTLLTQAIGLVLLAKLLLGRLPITGIHYGGRNSDRPGWWWIKSETSFVRRIGEGGKDKAK